MWFCCCCFLLLSCFLYCHFGCCFFWILSQCLFSFLVDCYYFFLVRPPTCPRWVDTEIPERPCFSFSVYRNLIITLSPTRYCRPFIILTVIVILSFWNKQTKKEPVHVQAILCVRAVDGTRTIAGRAGQAAEQYLPTMNISSLHPWRVCWSIGEY